MIRVFHPGSRSCFFYPSRIPDSGVKKASDPGSRYATLDKVDEAVNRFLEGPPSGSLLRKYLSRDIYASLRTAVTRSFHSSLWDVIRSGLSRPESELGLYAPDAEAYDTFAELLMPVIRDYHRLEGFLQHPASYWGEQGAAGGIGVFSSPHVVSTRIRLARSIAGTGTC
jgi:arginine kinase